MREVPTSGLRLYNTFTKREEEFQPREPGIVRMYTCGPTVYGRPHVGNYSSFLMADLLRRWLEVGHGLRVIHVKNITDVGHLVADADSGEDKVEKQAREEFGEVTHDTVIKLARKYEKQYLEDEQLLNMLEPAHRPRAMEFISEMKEMIEVLLQEDKAYVTDDGVYFDVHKFKGYGSLSGNTVENLESGARVDVNEQKEHPADFALWKFCVGQNENHALRWTSPGMNSPDGFPGWHIECSAMSRALLGDQIDIHTGGEDNIFPHHECEIAQSESVTGRKPFVRLWLHKRRIDVGREKMSKSLGNVLTVPDIQELGYSSLDLRYYLLSVHYRTPLKFTERGLEDAHKERRKIVEWMNDLESEAAKRGITWDHSREWFHETLGSSALSSVEVSKCDTQKWQAEDSWLRQFCDAMDADLNTPAARADIFASVTFFYKEQSEGFKNFDEGEWMRRLRFMSVVRHTFGCFEEEAQAIPSEIQSLVDEREEARAKKDFEKSDALRDEIREKGFEVRDSEDGPVVRKL